MGPKDPILGVSEAYNADPSPNKLNFGVGAYRDDESKPWVLPAVVEGERRAIARAGYNHEYAPIGGLPALAPLAQQLAFGENAADLESVVTLQSLSGTGSLRVLAGFIAAHWANLDALPTVFLPRPTWGNHLQIFNHAGINTDYYTYYNPETCGLDFNGMVQDIQSAPANSIFLFHATAHNPTGVDPSTAQWDEICQLVKKKQSMVIFDMAYQGFASGDCNKDAYSLRKFRAEGVRFMLAQSFAKNFGLYGQRAGAVSILCDDEAEKKRVESQVKIVARGIYSNPPVHGARIVYEILSDPQLKQVWLDNVETMAGRIIDMRSLLFDSLNKVGSQRNWQHIKDQIGMFCFSGMTAEQVDKLASDHSIYMTRNGRISMAGVTSKNVEQLARAMHEVTK